MNDSVITLRSINESVTCMTPLHM